MDWNPKGSKDFDKHKSWYKVDIDGDFITKNTNSRYTPKKKQSKNLSLERSRRVSKPKLYQKAVVSNDMRIVKHVEQKPESLSKTHELIFKLGIHLCFSLIMLLTAYCGFSYVLPTQIIKSNLSTLQIEEYYDVPCLQDLYTLNAHTKLWQNSSHKKPMQHFFSNRVLTSWNRIPEKFVRAPSLCFKNRFDKINISKLY